MWAPQLSGAFHLPEPGRDQGQQIIKSEHLNPAPPFNRPKDLLRCVLVISILQMRKRGNRDLVSLAWGHTLVIGKPMCVCACTRTRSVAQLCLTLCDPMDCSPPGSSVHVLPAELGQRGVLGLPLLLVSSLRVLIAVSNGRAESSPALQGRVTNDKRGT